MQNFLLNCRPFIQQIKNQTIPKRETGLNFLAMMDSQYGVRQQNMVSILGTVTPYFMASYHIVVMLVQYILGYPNPFGPEVV